MLLRQRAGKIHSGSNGEVPVDQRGGDTIQRARQLRRFQRFEHQPFRVAGDITLGGFGRVDIVFDGNQLQRLQETQTAREVGRIVRKGHDIALFQLIQALYLVGIETHPSRRHGE
ncbi:hypothetical protein D3C71_1112810 [compost metagenome]